MKKILHSLLSICLAASVCAQAPVPPASTEPQKLTAAELDKLLGPIALYPDPLVAIILPAAATPSDVIMASRMVASKADAATIEKQPWDASVKALTHYPDVLKWMDENLTWTTSAGNAFVNQPTDVMNSIQQLRAKAKAAGNLTSNPQQKVEVKEDKIIVVPAEPNVIYVPQYDPQVVYVESATPVVAPLITFGAGLVMGAWLSNGCNWNGGGVWCGGGYGYGGSYNNNVTINNNYNGNGGQQWRPPANRPGAPGRPGGAGGVGGVGGAGSAGGVGKPGGAGGVGGAGSAGGVGKPGGAGGVGGAGGAGGVGKPGGAGGVGGAGSAGGVGKPGGAGGAGGIGGAGSAGGGNRPSQSPASRPSNDAFNGYERGSSTREASSRGQSSRQSSMGSGGGSRSSGFSGGGGGSRGGGGGGGSRGGGGGRGR